jgi:hypothetical protein
MRNKTVLLILLVINTLGLFSQSSINSSSSEIKTANGSVSLTIGQVFYQDFIAVGGESLSQGIHTPFEISTTLGIENIGINLEMFVYPNPIVDHLNLSFKQVEIEDLSYMVYNLLGKEIINKKITTNQTVIDFKNVKNSVYFLKVFKKNQLIKTFKIIKR